MTHEFIASKHRKLECDRPNPKDAIITSEAFGFRISDIQNERRILVTVILARKKKNTVWSKAMLGNISRLVVSIGNLDEMLRDVQPVGVMFNPTGQTAQLNHQPFSTWLSNSTKKTDTPLG